MKQLNEFNNWADSVLKEFAGPSSKQKEKAPIGAEKDIARQSQTKYAGYDKDQALELFISDKLDDMEKRDLEQNKVINIQRKENDKLRSQLSTLSKEVGDIERDSSRDHQEIERIRSLATQIKNNAEERRPNRNDTEQELQQQLNQMKGDAEVQKASKKQIEQAMIQIDQLKNKPGMPPDKIAELEKSIEAAKNNAKEFNKIQDILNKLQHMERFDSREYDKLLAMYEKYKDDMEKKWKGRQKWGMTRLKNFDEKIKNIDSFLDVLNRDIDTVFGWSNELKKVLDYQVNKMIDIDDKHEKYLTKHEAEIEAEKELNIQQSEKIDYLDKAKADKRQQYRTSTGGSQNPYANVGNDEEDDITVNKNQANLFERQLNAMSENILGPQYSKYLK